MSVKYFKIVGIGVNLPSGLFRMTETEDEISFEHIDDSDKWVADPELSRYITGESDGAVEITEAEATKVRQFIKDRIKEDLAEAERY